MHRSWVATAAGAACLLALASGASAASLSAAKGKTTICHATGSAKHPYVRITVSNSALKAHRRHHDGRDIIPAPAGGCPGAAAAEGQGQGQGLRQVRRRQGARQGHDLPRDGV
ncbi:MAG: hypothetical protein ACXVFK_08275 [Solirubrobacteraceae bacterium]